MNGASISNHFYIFSRTERNKYYKHNNEARVNPKQFLSLIIDGMDQAKHNLPHFTTSTKVKSMLLVHVLNIYCTYIYIYIVLVLNIYTCIKYIYMY